MYSMCNYVSWLRMYQGWENKNKKLFKYFCQAYSFSALLNVAVRTGPRIDIAGLEFRNLRLRGTFDRLSNGEFEILMKNGLTQRLFGYNQVAPNC
jgi:hypothetical protein